MKTKQTPAADVKVDADVDIKAEVDADVNVDADGKVDVDADAKLDADANIDVDANVDVDVDRPRPDGGRREDSSGPRAPAQAREQVLSVENVHVRLAGRTVLEDVSFQVGAGELTGLIGSNGAGKTTLFRVVLGLQAAGRGQVLVAGRPRSRRNPLIGYVPQKFLLDPDMPLRARDLVALGVDAHRFGIARPSRVRRERAEEMLAAVDALDFADTRVGLLSGGEQQRVLIAHALVGRPRLLLADEPLANLDLRSADEVVALLARIAREQRIAVFISAHEINPLLPAMDRVVYLAAGRAVSGRTDEVVRGDVLSHLYGHHVDVLHVHGRVIVVAGAPENPDLSGHELRFPEAESGAEAGGQAVAGDAAGSDGGGAGGSDGGAAEKAEAGGSDGGGAEKGGGGA